MIEVVDCERRLASDQLGGELGSRWSSASGAKSALVLQPRDVEQVEPAVAEAGADFAEQGLARGAAELADLRDR